MTFTECSQFSNIHLHLLVDANRVIIKGTIQYKNDQTILLFKAYNSGTCCYLQDSGFAFSLDNARECASVYVYMKNE